MAFAAERVHRLVMTTGDRARTRPAPTAHCRLCSATTSIDAPTTDRLRICLREFMAEHRHDGLADIVIDISDDRDDDVSDVHVSDVHEIDVTDAATASVSRL
jgi:hypothetical protein